MHAARAKEKNAKLKERAAEVAGLLKKVKKQRARVGELNVELEDRVAEVQGLEYKSNGLTGLFSWHVQFGVFKEWSEPDAENPESERKSPRSAKCSSILIFLCCYAVKTPLTM